MALPPLRQKNHIQLLVQQPIAQALVLQSFETFARPGHGLILHRRGKKRPSLRRGGALAGMVRPRYPVAERKVITLASMFDRSAVYDPVEDLIGEVFEHEFARQLTVLS